MTGHRRLLVAVLLTALACGPKGPGSDGPKSSTARAPAARQEVAIARQAVSSSALRSAGYRASDKTLAIEFTNGSIYHYRDVPKSVYDGLMSAGSKGKYFHSAIKGRYEHKQR